jgi:hypothetical protein
MVEHVNTWLDDPLDSVSQLRSRHLLSRLSRPGDFVHSPLAAACLRAAAWLHRTAHSYILEARLPLLPASRHGLTVTHRSQRIAKYRLQGYEGFPARIHVKKTTSRLVCRGSNEHDDQISQNISVQSVESHLLKRWTGNDMRKPTRNVQNNLTALFATRSTF